MNDRVFFSKIDFQLLNYASYYLAFVYPEYKKPHSGDRYLFAQVVEGMYNRVEEIKGTTKLKRLVHYFHLAIKTMNKSVEEELKQNGKRYKPIKADTMVIDGCLNSIKSAHEEAAAIISLYDFGIIDEDSDHIAHICL